MATRPEQLAEVLNKGLAPVYLVSGDDTLLVTEACDQIVAAAKQQGFTERSVHHVETGFSWHGLSKMRSMSLFAERKILMFELPARNSIKRLLLCFEWVADGSNNPDTVLLLRTDRLQPKQRRCLV